MLSALKLKTTILPSQRIEVSAPGLVEGNDVELIVLRPKATPTPLSPEKVLCASTGDYLVSPSPADRIQVE